MAYVDFPLDPHVHALPQLGPESQVRAAHALGMNINIVNYYSTQNFETLRNEAKERLPEFAVTSYDRMLKVSKDNRTITVFRGQEAVIDGNRHIIAGGLKTAVDNELSLEDTLDQIDRQGAFRYAPHHPNTLFNGIGRAAYLDFNQVCSTEGVDPLIPEYNSWNCGPFEKYNRMAQIDGVKCDLIPVGGSDAKRPGEVGTAHSVFRIPEGVSPSKLVLEVRQALQHGKFMPVKNTCDTPSVFALVAYFKLRETWRYLRGHARTDAFGILPPRDIKDPDPHV